MKNGFLFFLNMGNITKGARIAIIPGILFIILARGYFLMILSALFMAVCLLLSIIRTPSDKDVVIAINDFYRSFEEFISKKRENKVEHTYIKGYRIKGKMFLKRYVEGKVVYPSPVALSVVPINGGGDYCLMFASSSLIKKEKTKFEQYNLSEKSWKLRGEFSAEDDYVTISICVDGIIDDLQIVTQNNYRTRELLDVVNAI